MLILYNRTLISGHKNKKNIMGDNHKYVAINSYKRNHNMHDQWGAMRLQIVTSIIDKHTTTARNWWNYIYV